ncbi:Biopolymer transport protein ExbB [Planctomycetales bacterium 10988]|nr:Biopolymer transport protein ExbB [Planctomycetales bacterium 10988]
MAGGWVGAVILLLSIGMVALFIEHTFRIRAAAISPPGLAESVQQHLLQGQIQEAEQQCFAQPSFLGSVLKAGIDEVDCGWASVEKAMEDVSQEEAARLYRRAEYLSVIGNIAPMLGLLGTVIGMVMAFKEVADTQGAARAADLANGIYLALVTTVEGLVVAIPAMAGFAVIRNRIDELVAEASHAALAVFTPLRKNRRARTGRTQANAPTQESV